MKIKIYILVMIIIGISFPLFAKAGWIDDVFKIISLASMIPDEEGTCVRSIDGDVGGSRQRVEDERGVSFKNIMNYRCSEAKQICRVTGSGQIDGNLDGDTRYDLFIEWGTCAVIDEGGDNISNLRKGLSDLKDIFPSRLRSERGIINTIGAIIRWVLGIAGAIFVAMVVFGGIQYLTVGASEKNIEKAKHSITYAVIGMVIIAGAWLIADFVISMLIRGA